MIFKLVPAIIIIVTCVTACYKPLPPLSHGPFKEVVGIRDLVDEPSYPSSEPRYHQRLNLDESSGWLVTEGTLYHREGSIWEKQLLPIPNGFEIESIVMNDNATTLLITSYPKNDRSNFSLFIADRENDIWISKSLDLDILQPSRFEIHHFNPEGTKFILYGHSSDKNSSSPNHIFVSRIGDDWKIIDTIEAIRHSGTPYDLSFNGTGTRMLNEGKLYELKDSAWQVIFELPNFGTELGFSPNARLSFEGNNIFVEELSDNRRINVAQYQEIDGEWNSGEIIVTEAMLPEITNQNHLWNRSVSKSGNFLTVVEIRPLSILPIFPFEFAFRVFEKDSNGTWRPVATFDLPVQFSPSDRFIFTADMIYEYQ